MDPAPSTAVATVARNLQIEVTAAEVIARLTSQGVRCLLLKGPTIARWLYDAPGERGYIDCDLLVEPAAFERAAAHLGAMGFEKQLEDIRPRGLPAHTQNWLAENGVLVELHRYLVGVQAKPDVAFEEFFGDAVEMDLTGQVVLALGPPARALHLALHVGQHGGKLKKALDDLERGIARLPRTVWSETAAVAERVGATEALVAGLGLVDRGERLIADLGLPTAVSRETALRAAGSDSPTLAVEWLVQAKGWRVRAVYVLRKLFPPPRWVRTIADEPNARGGRLLLLYLLRVASSLRRAPRAIAAWWGFWRTHR